MDNQPCHLAQMLPLSSEHVDPSTQDILCSPADTGSFLPSKVTGLSAYKHSSCLPDINADCCGRAAGYYHIKKIYNKVKNQKPILFLYPEPHTSVPILLLSCSGLVGFRFTKLKQGSKSKRQNSVREDNKLCCSSKAAAGCLQATALPAVLSGPLQQQTQHSTQNNKPRQCPRPLLQFLGSLAQA